MRLSPNGKRRADASPAHPTTIANRALAIQQSANRSMSGVFNVWDTHDPDDPTIVDLYPESLTPLPET